MVSGSEQELITNNREQYFLSLLKDIVDLESTTFREHWYYRVGRYRINTGDKAGQKYLMMRAKEYRGKRGI